MEVLFIDCETGGADGVSPQCDYALVQLSAIIEIDGKEVDCIDLKMKPYGKRIVTPKALGIQGRTMEEVDGFDDPKGCFVRFKNFLARRPASKQNRYIMAGYNADFDCRFISEWFKDMSGGPYEYWNYMQFSPIDVLSILRIMRHYKMIDIPDTKLGTVCKFFEIEFNAHDSMSDIRATRQLTNIIVEKIKAGIVPA
jgi:DNA polymerase-3 subunit epsilon